MFLATWTMKIVAVWMGPSMMVRGALVFYPNDVDNSSLNVSVNIIYYTLKSLQILFR